MADEAPVKKRRKRRVNKSAMIRQFIADHPDMGPTAIAQEMGKRKVKVSAAYVSDIKAKAKGGEAPRKPGRKKKSADSSPSQDMQSASKLMMDAIDLVVKAGYKEAKSMIEMASEMINRVRENSK